MPVGIAAVIATILLFVSANFASVFPEKLRVGRESGGGGFPGIRLEFTESMELVGPLKSGSVALALSESVYEAELARFAFSESQMSE